MAYKTWKEAYKQSIGLKEAKYTNIHNRIKNIRNLDKKTADMIADIAPAVLAKVLQNLYPMFKAQRLVSSVYEEDEMKDAGTSLKISDTSSSAFNKLKTIAKDLGVEITREEDHLLVQGDAKKMEEFKAQMSVAMKEEISEGRLDYHKKSPAELKGAQFDRKKEINNIKKMIKGIEKLNKEHEKFQYNNRTTSGDRIFRGLYAAEDALYRYMLEIERGEWDGKVELES